MYKASINAVVLTLLTLTLSSAFANGKGGDDDEDVIQLDRLVNINLGLSSSGNSGESREIALNPGLLHAVNLTLWSGAPGSNCFGNLSINKEYENGDFRGAVLISSSSNDTAASAVDHEYAAPIRVQFKEGVETVYLTLSVGPIGVAPVDCRVTFSALYEEKGTGD